MENLTYDEFIQNILDTRGRFACGEEYHEKHHIIPRCMDGTDDKGNLIDLFAREHFIAHKLLAQENPNNNSIVYAYGCMAWRKSKNHERYELTPEEYEEAKIVFNKANSRMAKERYSIPENTPMYGRKHTEESKEKMRGPRPSIQGENNPNYGKILPIETVQKISENHADMSGSNNPMYGKHHSEETRKKISDLAKARVTDEWREYISEINKKENLSEETLRLRSEQAKLRVGGLNSNAKRIIRLLDLKIYDCMKDSMEDNDICRTTMTKRCNERKDFMYYDEWLELQNKLEEIDELQAI